MKFINLKYLTIVALTSSLLISCSEDVYEGLYRQPSLERHYLDVYPRDFEFGNGEETETGTVRSENAWSFTSVPSWLSLTPTNGNSNTEFSVTSAINESALKRTAVFYVSSTAADWNRQIPITASQSEAIPFIRFPNLESSTIEASAAGQTLTIDVASNLDDFKVSFGESWGIVSYDKTTKKISITLQQNNRNISRTGMGSLSGYIKHDGGSRCVAEKSFKITQHASNISVLDENALSFDANGGSITKTIKSDLPWTAKTTYPWIEFTPKSGPEGSSNISITALPSYEANTRTGQIYFYFGETEKKYLSITQTGRYIKLSNRSITIPAEDNNGKRINIESNIGWKVSSCPDWVELSQKQGNAGKSEITVRATKNNSLNSRSGTIEIFDSHSGGIKTNLTVIQNGLDFGDNTTLEFSWHQSSLPLEIPLPGNWNAAVSVGWITLSDYTGIGNKTITVSVSKNEAEDPRTGKISFTSEGKTIEVTIIQMGQYIKLDNTSGEFNALGGTLKLSIASSLNTSWKVEYPTSIDNWVTVDEVNKDEYVITVAYNPSTINRSATFVVSPTDEDVSENNTQGVKLSIKQSGRTISCDVSKISITSNGGTSQTYKIAADGKYTIDKEPEDNWYTIVSDTTTDTFYIVVTDNTSDSDRVGHIVLSLAELPHGETLSRKIEVFQYKQGINILFDNFDDETIW